MKKLFVICLLSLINSTFSAQTDSFVVYKWSDLKKFDPDTIYGLSFEKLKMEKLPKELNKFNNLKHLDLSKNNITELPTFIGEFIHLEYLNIAKNKFQTFPIEICRLNNLRTLIANRNNFDKIPECIGYCERLEIIDLWNTPIMHFPESIQNLKSLKEIDLQGIKYGPTFQKDFQNQLPWVKIKFDPPCDCMK